ncbi:MAG: GNAT family N-acetyltransferase [Myxococcales bacterium]|nr:GNAT family N-acetyltransferase [Myxococcales bacterium]
MIGRRPTQQNHPRVGAKLLRFTELGVVANMAEAFGYGGYSQGQLESTWTRVHTLCPALVTDLPLPRRVLGFMVLEGVPPEMELHLVLLASNMRGQGWGRRLMAYGEAQAFARGMDSIYLEVAASTNPRARAMYEARGYLEVGRRSQYYSNGDDAVVYQLRRRSAPKMTQDLVLLMGGKGTRLGGALKAAFRNEHGDPLLVHMLKCFSPLKAFAVAPAEMYPSLATIVADAGAEALVHQWVEDVGQGPGPAIFEAARVSSADELLIVAVDHPRPSPALMGRLSQAAVGAQGAWVRNQGDHLEALVSVVRREPLLAHWDGYEVPHSARGLMAPLLMAEVDEAELPPDEREALRDVDTREDAQALGVRAATSGQVGPL